MRTVLIADDSKTSVMLVKTTLQRIPDLAFVTVENGAQALDVLANGSVDLLVSDINMPEMDGVELVRAVRRAHDAKSLPIVMITAKSEEAARQEALKLGANACILKPISGRELTAVATRLLSGEDLTAAS
jgi:two-component system chemotaxis response regulator CheY